MARITINGMTIDPLGTYLCGYRPADLGAVRALPFVAWADVYLEGFKIAPSFRPGGLQSDLALPVALAAPTGGSGFTGACGRCGVS
ncbi:hypothetical protein [Streptomyces sp. NPDC023838]|uniref:hypothetical protein n=1 Tax=Streptomyces sp. NPDC023838 TaxID=3154325 RepID=UPI0033FDF14D